MTSRSCVNSHVLWCPAYYDASDLSGEHLEGVLPTNLLRLGGFWCLFQEWGYVRVSPERSRCVWFFIVYWWTIVGDVFASWEGRVVEANVSAEVTVLAVHQLKLNQV